MISLFDLLRQGGWAMFPLGTLSFVMCSLALHAFHLTRPKVWGAPDALQADSHAAALAALPLSARLTELEAIESRTNQWIQYLNVVATIAPMVGLLGTVSGMIGAFQTIASGGMGKPEKLAGDIGEALITTATGLTIGIPAMILFFVLRNRLDNRSQCLAPLLDPQDPPCDTAPPHAATLTQLSESAASSGTRS